MLHAVLVFHTTKATAAEVDEVLPKGLAANASAVTFQPQPKVIQADPVVFQNIISNSKDQYFINLHIFVLFTFQYS